LSALKDTVIDGTLEKVRVVYLDRDTAKWWNQRRDKQDTAMFCGYYWIRGSDEAGPFRTRSAAIRDAYYRFVLNREPPTIAVDRAGQWRRGRVKIMRAKGHTSRGAAL
jgi:hypothetical protein